MTLKIKDNYWDETVFQKILYITRKFELQGSFLWIKDPSPGSGIFPDPGDPKKPDPHHWLFP